MLTRLVLFVCLAMLGVGCSSGGGAADAGSDAADSSRPDAAGPTVVQMDFTRAGGFFTAPFPSEDRRTAAGRIDLTGYPNPFRVTFVSTMVDLIQRDADGFGLSSAVYFTLTGALDPARLPTLRQSLEPAASVFLIN